MRSRKLSKSVPVYPPTNNKKSYDTHSSRTSPGIEYIMDHNAREFVPYSVNSDSNSNININNNKNVKQYNIVNKRINVEENNDTFLSSSHGGTKRSTKVKYLCAIQKYKLKKTSSSISYDGILGGEIIIFDEKINMQKYIKRLKDYTNGEIYIYSKKLDINLSAAINPKSEYGNITRGYVKGLDDSGKFAIVISSSRYYLVPFNEITYINVKTSPVPSNFYK